MIPTDNRAATNEESRVGVIKSIWKATVASFALCIPITLFIGPFSGGLAILVPLGIAASAAVATVVVWTFRPSNRNFAELEAKIQALDQRVGNVELIEATSIKISNRHSVTTRPEPQLEKPTN